MKGGLVYILHTNVVRLREWANSQLSARGVTIDEVLEAKHNFNSSPIKWVTHRSPVPSLQVYYYAYVAI